MATCIHVPFVAFLQLFYIDPVSSTVKWAYNYSFTRSMHIKEYINTSRSSWSTDPGTQWASKIDSLYFSTMLPRIRVQRQEGSRCCSTLLCTVCRHGLSRTSLCVFKYVLFNLVALFHRSTKVSYFKKHEHYLYLEYIYISEFVVKHLVTIGNIKIELTASSDAVILTWQDYEWPCFWRRNSSPYVYLHIKVKGKNEEK